VVAVKKNGFKPWERRLKTSTGKVGISAELVADTNQERKTEAVVASQSSTTTPRVSEAASVDAPEALGTVSLASNPSGADIYVDNSFVGKTPATLRIKQGPHTIRMFMTDYKNWSRWTVVQAGAEISETAELEKSN
jgi:hypothetical protein